MQNTLTDKLSYHIASAFIRRQNPVINRKNDCPQVVADGVRMLLLRTPGNLTVNLLYYRLK